MCIRDSFYFHSVSKASVQFKEKKWVICQLWIQGSCRLSTDFIKIYKILDDFTQYEQRVMLTHLQFDQFQSTDCHELSIYPVLYCCFLMWQASLSAVYVREKSGHFWIDYYTRRSLAITETALCILLLDSIKRIAHFLSLKNLLTHFKLILHF